MKNRDKLRPTRAQKIAASREAKRESKYAAKGERHQVYSQLAEGLQKRLDEAKAQDFSEACDHTFPEAR